MKMYAIIVAAGAGRRMQSHTPKQFLLLQGKPIYYYPVNTFLKAIPDVEVILVVPSSTSLPAEELLQCFGKHTQIKIVAGGETRFESVKNGLEAIDDEGLVFIHDSVRPFITTTFIQMLSDAAMQNGNAIPCIDISDSLRMVTENENRSISREQFKAIQTPQVFQVQQIKHAYQQVYTDAFTDDASVLESAGFAIHVTKGLTENIKITTPVDLKYAELIIQDVIATDPTFIL